MRNCDVCLDLDWDLYTHIWDHADDATVTEKAQYTDSGSLATSASNGCEICSVLHQGIVGLRQFTAELESPWPSWDFSGPHHVTIILRPERSLLLSLQEDFKGENRKLTEDSGEVSATFVGPRPESPDTNSEFVIDIEYFICAGQPAPPWNAFGLGRQVPEIMDKMMYVQIIRDWLSSCDNNHTCISKELPGLPTRVLDLSPLGAGNDVALVETSGETARYMTLSHCWGTSQMIQTRKETLTMMKNGIPWSNLPRTFQDAISVAQCLGIQYLWIDSLCIIQDDTPDWERESSRMASIYANTYLNIAATSSGGSDGGCFKPRWIEAMVRGHFVKFPVKDIKTHGSYNGTAFEVFARFERNIAHRDYQRSGYGRLIYDRSPLLTRAWVLQELALSPRSVHFHSSELVWECKGCICCECGELENEVIEQTALPRHRAFQMPFALNSDQRIYRWLLIVDEYCKLSLTLESDRLPALAGLASRFEDETTGRYLGGLWQNDLVRMLLWSLNSSRVTCTRSHPSDAPSWSWASLIADSDPYWRENNPPNYTLVQGSPTSFKQDNNARVLNFECTVPSINPFGQVSAGTLVISGRVLHSTLVRRRLLACIGRNVVETTISLLWSDYMQTNSKYRTYSERAVHRGTEINVGADLIFEQEVDDFVIVSRQGFMPDISLGEEKEIRDGDMVICLPLGENVIPWDTGDLNMALCLVLRYCPGREGVFERIGVMMCEPNSIIFSPSEHRIIELV